MSAIRLARGFTKRDKIIKFDGCYHGHGDSLLVRAGSGALTFGHPDSAGVPADFAKHTLVLPYNETEPLTAAFTRIENCSFRTMVVPGDDLFLLCQELKWSRRGFTCAVQGVVAGKITFEAQMQGLAV